VQPYVVSRICNNSWILVVEMLVLAEMAGILVVEANMLSEMAVFLTCNFPPPSGFKFEASSYVINIDIVPVVGRIQLPSSALPKDQIWFPLRSSSSFGLLFWTSQRHGFKISLITLSQPSGLLDLCGGSDTAPQGPGVKLRAVGALDHSESEDSG
jgi:hypothetical protein